MDELDAIFWNNWADDGVAARKSEQPRRLPLSEEDELYWMRRILEADTEKAARGIIERLHIWQKIVQRGQDKNFETVQVSSSFNGILDRLSDQSEARLLRKMMAEGDIVTDNEDYVVDAGLRDISSLAETLKDLGRLHGRIYGTGARSQISAENEDGFVYMINVVPWPQYCALKATMIAYRGKLDEARKRLEDCLEEKIKEATPVNITWRLEESTEEFPVIYDEVLHDEAYPSIPESIDEKVDQYFRSEESILILYGPQGTGKSRLIRYLLQSFAAKSDSDLEALFTSSYKVSEAEWFFSEFAFGGYQCLVLEDADKILKSREKENNTVVHKYLSISDGLFNVDKKIILSTNMQVNEIDPALKRPGRCFDVIETDFLPVKNAKALYRKISNDGKEDEIVEPVTVAQVYALSKGRPLSRFENKTAGLNSKKQTGF